MSDDISAEIISIGTEILLGELTDTNSAFIARTMRDLGIDVHYMTSVGDNVQRISGTVQQALQRADIVITCGGLGPTVDDMTRLGIAQATNRELIYHQFLFDQIVERFTRFKVQMTENNKRQAYLPEGAIAVENPVGTAPAFIVEHHNNIVICLPGVPREMKYLIHERITGYLQERYNLGIIKAKVLKTAGVGESTLDTLLGDDLLMQGNPSIGLAAHSGQIDVRLTVKAASAQKADELLGELEGRVQERIGQHIFGTDDDTLEEVVGNLLLSINGKVIVIEAGSKPIIQDTLRQANPEAAGLIMTRHYDDVDTLIREVGLPTVITYRQLSETADLYFTETMSHMTKVAATVVIITNPLHEEGGDNDEATVIRVSNSKQIRQRAYGFGARYGLASKWIQSWTLATLWYLLKDLE